MTSSEIDSLIEQQHDKKYSAMAESNDPDLPPAVGQPVYFGYDGEWEEKERTGLNPLQALSYQFHAVGVGGQLSCTYIPASGCFKDRLALQEMLGDVIEEMYRRGLILEYPTHIIFVGFFLRIDLALLSDLIEFKAQLGNVGGKIATVGKPVPVGLVCSKRDLDHVDDDRAVYFRNGRNVTKVHVTFYDIARHAAEKTPLADLGELIHLPKKHINPPYSISRMDEYRRKKFRKFIRYGMQDAQIPVLYYLHVLKFAQEQVGGPRISQGFLPVSAGSLAVQMLRKKLKDAGLDYEQVFGVTYKTQQPWDERSSRYRYRRGKVKDTYRLIRETFAVLCYHGGRNESYYFGLGEVGNWYDFDLIGAYTMGMLVIRPIDYANSYETRDINEFMGDVMGFAWVQFEFPAGRRFPCLPVRTPSESLVFPRCGESYCTAPELALAIRLGATVSIKYGVMFPWQDPDKRVFEAFVREIRRLRAAYPKGSTDEQYAKLLGNALYGKTAQGLKEKTAFDTGTMENKKISESGITNGMMAAFVTGTIRALLGEILNGIPEHRTVISCTTDGILTDAREDELDLSGELAQRYMRLVERVTA